MKLNSFQLNGNPALIPASAFTVVPNSAGVWMYAHITFNTTDIPMGTNNLITNSSDVFSVALINGGASSGTRFGYFSEFNGKINISAGGAQTVCANDSVTLIGTVSGATTTGQWSTSGTGFFLPDDITLNAMYVPSVGDLGGSIDITLTSTGACTPEIDVATITFTPSPLVDAGADILVCKNNANVLLAGSISVATTTGVWSGGGGTFTPNATTLNATYTPLAAELTAGNVTLTLTSTGNGICNPESDMLVITYTVAPTVDAGAPQSVCSNNATVNLNGSVTVATGAQWSGGAGIFTPNINALNAIYTPTVAEISAGSVNLILTTTGNGTCSPEADNVLITFSPSPTADAGTPQSVCGNNSAVTLAGSVTVATAGSWVGGLGTYTPNANTLNAVYTPSAAEITAGTVILTLTSTGNGLCNAETDNVVITITDAPVVNAGMLQTLCANNADATLNGSVTIATGGQWSGGTGVYSPNANTLNAVYTPSATEIATGSVLLILTSTGNGSCNTSVDNVLISYTPAPTTNAGADINVCANNVNVNLTGIITVASGGVWLGGTGSFSPNATDLNAVYTPSAAEITAGTVTLTLSSTGNGSCLTVTDDIEITIAPLPIVNAGANLTSCANNPDVNLAGIISNATGGIWSGGTGTYNPNATDLNAVYTPSAAEITAGTVSLMLTSTGNGSCNAASQSMIITINNSPIADAGVDQTLCSNNADISLAGTVINAAGGQWSGGLGIFTPASNVLNAVYTPTAGELLLGSITLTLTTTGNATCNPESNDVLITFTPSPTVDAGVSLTSCANNQDVTLAGVVAISTGGIWSGGTGVYTPNSNTLNAVYTPSSAEITVGTTTLTLTTTGNGNCNSEQATVVITIDPLPVVDAGLDQTICVNNLNVPLAGSVSGITNTGIWTTSGSGIFVPNNTNLNATYYFV